MSDSEMEERLEELGARIMELRGELAGLEAEEEELSKAKKRKRG